MKPALHACLCLLALTGAALLGIAAFAGWQNLESAHASMANLDAATYNLRTATERVAALIGPLETQERKPQTLAVTVAELNATLRTTDQTVAAGQPLLREATARVREGKGATQGAVRVLGRADDLLANVSRDLGPVMVHADGLVMAAGPVLENASKITAQVAEASPLFFDCDHNPSCAFNLFQGTAKSAERMAQAWERAAPATAQAVQQTTQNVEQLSKPGWFTRLIKRIF